MGRRVRIGFLLVLLGLMCGLPTLAVSPPSQFLPDVVAIAQAQAEAAAAAAAQAQAAAGEAREILADLEFRWLVEAAQRASYEAQDSAEAVTAAIASAEVYVEEMAEACEEAVARAEASARACAAAAARAEAVAEALAEACAGASATAAASVWACADAMAEADVAATALVTAAAQAYAEARANAEACAQARAEVEVYAEAVATALARAEARALAQVEAAAEAWAQAKAEASAVAEAAASARAHAAACAAAHAYAHAEAQAAAKSYSEVRDLAFEVKERVYEELPHGCGYVVADVEGSVDGAVTASAEASASAEAAAEATALALAASSARAEAAAAAEARAKAQATAAGRAHAEALAAAEAVATAKAQAIAIAEAAAEAIGEAYASAQAQAAACAQALAAAEAAAEAMARAVGDAHSSAEAEAEALAEACAEASAAATAAADAVGLAEAAASAEAEAAAGACAQAQAAATAMAQALASAEAAAMASAQASAEAYAEAQSVAAAVSQAVSEAVAEVARHAEAAAAASATATAEAEACAQAAASAHAEAQASAEAAGTGEVYATAYAAAEATGSAEAIAHATACAQAAAEAQASAGAAATGLARARAVAAAGLEAVAEAAMRAQDEALASAHAHAEAEAEVAAGVEALAEASAEALASAYAAAEVATSAYAEALASAEASAEAQAGAFAYAHAAAMAQATAKAEVAVGVRAMADAFAEASAAAYAAAIAEVRAQAEAYAAAQALAQAEAEAYAAAQVCALASASAEASAAAAAEVHVRTMALAKANAQALAQASVVARAAARAAAMAHTSVDIVTNIDASIYSFIDPSCLEDVCPPECPTPATFQWDCCVDWVPGFGEVFTRTPLAQPWEVCPLPEHIRAQIATLQPTHAEVAFSDLPDGLEFTFDLAALQGTLSGHVPAGGGTWQVRVDLYDADECLVALLYLTITIPCEIPCPDPQTFEWDCCEWMHPGTDVVYRMMMETDVELPFSLICPVPDHLRARIAALGATQAVVKVSDLPRGLEFLFDLETLQGVVYGQAPAEPGSWLVMVELVDEHNCVVAELWITVTIPCEEICTTHTFRWHFGEFRAGMSISRMASLPRDIHTQIEALSPTRSVISESNLPRGLNFEFLVDSLQGRITGQVPSEGGSWTVKVDLFDASQCHVAEIFVSITSPEAIPDLSVRITRTSVVDECDDYSHRITVSWQATGGRAPISVRPSIVLPDGRQVTAPGTHPATGTHVIGVTLFEGGTVRARVDATDAAGQTTRAEQAIRLNPCVVEEECPPLQRLTWEFGELEGGKMHFTLRQMPPALLSQIQAAGITRDERISGTVPAGSFNLDLDQGAALFIGATPTRPTKYEVVYSLFDKEECERFHLTVAMWVGETVVNDKPIDDPRQAQLDVRAVYVDPDMAHYLGDSPTTSHVLRTFKALNVPVQVVGERAGRRTPFTLTRPVGTQVGLQFAVRLAGGVSGHESGTMPAGYSGDVVTHSAYMVAMQPELLGFAVRIGTREQFVPLPEQAWQATHFVFKPTLSANTLVVAVYGQRFVFEPLY